ncbi:MAG: hypothetical protein WAV91_02610 [Aquabacterium sp.]
MVKLATFDAAEYLSAALEDPKPDTQLAKDAGLLCQEHKHGANMKYWRESAREGITS